MPTALDCAAQVADVPACGVAVVLGEVSLLVAAVKHDPLAVLEPMRDLTKPVVVSGPEVDDPPPCVVADLREAHDVPALKVESSSVRADYVEHILQLLGCADHFILGV